MTQTELIILCKEKIKKDGLSDRKASELIGISAAQLCRLFKDNSRLTDKTISKLAYFVGVLDSDVYNVLPALDTSNSILHVMKLRLSNLEILSESIENEISELKKIVSDLEK